METRMRHALIAASLALLSAAPALGAPAASGGKDGVASIKESLVSGCSDESKEAVATGVRDNIEAEVKKGEEAIKPPAQVGDLSCLDGLLELPIDKFSGIGGMLGDLQGGFDMDVGGLLGDGSLDQKICAFAQEKWGEVTEPLTSAIGKIDLGSIADGIDLKNGGGKAPTNTPSRNSIPKDPVPPTTTTPTPTTPTPPVTTTPTTPFQPSTGGGDGGAPAPVPSTGGSSSGGGDGGAPSPFMNVYK